MSDRISWFPIADRETCAPETRALFDLLEEKLGFVPNVFRAFAWREERMTKWRAHFDDLMTPSEGLTKVDREMISVVVSMQNQCLYCLTSHGFALRALLKDPVKGDRIVLDYRRAGLSEKQMAMLDFAVKLTLDPVTVAEEDIDELRAVGFSDDRMEIGESVLHGIARRGGFACLACRSRLIRHDRNPFRRNEKGPVCLAPLWGKTHWSSLFGRVSRLVIRCQE